MASNYPSDRDAAPISNPATPQSGPNGTVPEMPLSPVFPEVVPVPVSAQPSASTPSSGEGAGGDGRRLPAGTVLSGGRYRIEKAIASGGMGAVYRAIDLRFDRPCAVKEMLDDFQNDTERSQARDWFKREATLLLELSHPYIPRVRDFFQENGKYYLVMDFIEGRTLGEILEKEGNVHGLNGARGLPEQRVRGWAQQVCNVLGYLHRENPPIIFRDLKPSNIMVNNHDEIRLIDFGIARPFQSQTQSTIIFTHGYAAPEQLLASAEPRSDIYALGATLHRLLTHHDAANNKPTIFTFPPIRTLRPDVSVAFEQLVMKALAPQVEQRWSSAIEMERAIMNLPQLQTVQNQSSARQSVSSGSGSNPQTPARPQTGSIFIKAAQDHLNAGRIDAAYAAVQQAYAAEPNNAAVHKIFGQVFARRQQPSPDLAMQAYTRSLQLDPNDAETHKLTGDIWLYLRRQPAQAIPAYTQSLRLNPNDFEARQRLAKCYEETNQLEPALREYQEAARLAPKRAELHYAVGQLASRMNQLPVAERAYVQVLMINPADHSTRFLLSQVYEREGKLEDARRECLYVIGAMPGNSAAQAMLQRLRDRLGR